MTFLSLRRWLSTRYSCASARIAKRTTASAGLISWAAVSWLVSISCHIFGFIIYLEKFYSGIRGEQQESFETSRAGSRVTSVKIQFDVSFGENHASWIENRTRVYEWYGCSSNGEFFEKYTDTNCGGCGAFLSYTHKQSSLSTAKSSRATRRRNRLLRLIRRTDDESFYLRSSYVWKYFFTRRGKVFFNTYNPRWNGDATFACAVCCRTRPIGSLKLILHRSKVIITNKLICKTFFSKTRFRI